VTVQFVCYEIQLPANCQAWKLGENPFWNFYYLNNFLALLNIIIFKMAVTFKKHTQTHPQLFVTAGWFARY
jgi:hypothetical protein